MSKSKNRVVLGLSGGVDSATAALLLKEKGFEVIGFYFDVLGTNVKGAEEARNLAGALDIELIDMDVHEEFNQVVVKNFCSEYCSGRTPNPCIICNPAIKFRYLLEIADRKDAYYIATGHYARTFCDKDGIFFIQKGASEKKDQSYMLCRLGQEVLSRLILPLGDIEEKETTRALAREYGLINAEAADSQEICFIDEKKEAYTEFIKRQGGYFPEGNFIDESGQILGRHKGICYYTIGQRKGLGIALGKPAFVTSIDATANTVTLGSNDDLFSKQVLSSDNFFAATAEETLPVVYENNPAISAKIRYAAKAAPAILRQLDNGKIMATFAQPQRAATPGQTIVFYQGDLVIGGGFIE